MNERHCRWGILGSAGIARKNWQAIRHSGNGRLVAVASRSREKAATFIAESQAQVPHDPAPEAVAGYAELLSRPDIDAVYIPLPTGLRKEWVLAAAAAGKHVLCEKPCGVDAGEVREITEACAKAGVQFMDGVMFMHNDRLAALRAELDAGAIGRVRRIATQFSFLAPEEFFTENIRLNPGLEPLGSLGDLGWYNVRIILWALRYEMPVAVTARMIREHHAVPVSLSAELVFAEGVTASFYCSFENEHQQWVNLSGTGGHIQVSDFVLPFHGPELAFEIEQAHFAVEGCHFHMERHSRRVATREYSDSHATAQESRLFRKFGDLVLGGVPDPHWSDISLKTQLVLDACLKSAREGAREVAL
jgi:predicted dehydrogenase